MNIGDIVYIYLFDLEKSILHMNQLRDDRFGRITAINTRSIIGSNDKEIIYTIKTKNNIVEYVSSNVNYSIISIAELMNLIGNVGLSIEKRDRLIKQIQIQVQQI